MSTITSPQGSPYAPARLIDPSPAGFLHLAIESRRGRRPGPVLRRETARERVVRAARDFADRVAARDEVLEATVFRGVLVAPAPPAGDGVPQADVAVLVETRTPDDAAALRTAPELAGLLETVAAGGGRWHLFVARNARRIADVEHADGGLFLFNHFVAEDPEAAAVVWERLAGWYQAETGLRNSVLLAPAEGEPSSLALVNHASWRIGLARFALHQFGRPSFWSYVRPTLRANGMTAVPALYRLAGRAGA